MKRFTSALLLATLLVTGGAASAQAAPTKTGASVKVDTSVAVSFLDRVGGWPY